MSQQCLKEVTLALVGSVRDGRLKLVGSRTVACVRGRVVDAVEASGDGPEVGACYPVHGLGVEMERRDVGK